jgi:hypothetical protein
MILIVILIIIKNFKKNLVNKSEVFDYHFIPYTLERDDSH